MNPVCMSKHPSRNNTWCDRAPSHVGPHRDSDGFAWEVVPAGSYTRTDEPCGPCDALRGVIKQAEEDCRKYRRERDGARSQAEKAERERDAAQAEAAMCQTSLSGQIRRAEKAEGRARRAEESRPTMFAESLGGMTIWGIREARREFLDRGLTYKDVRRIVELASTPEPEPTRPEGATYWDGVIADQVADDLAPEAIQKLADTIAIKSAENGA